MSDDVGKLVAVLSRPIVPVIDWIADNAGLDTGSSGWAIAMAAWYSYIGLLFAGLVWLSIAIVEMKGIGDNWTIIVFVILATIYIWAMIAWNLADPIE